MRGSPRGARGVVGGVVVAALAVGLFAAGAYGLDAPPFRDDVGSSATSPAQSDGSRPERPMDPEDEGVRAVATPVTADDLWSIHEEAASCYEEHGYTVIGPLPTPGGRGVGFDIGLPENPPFDDSAVSDPCSERLMPNNLRFNMDASPADHQVLATVRRSIVECVAGQAPAMAPSYQGAGPAEVLELLKTETFGSENSTVVDGYVIAAGQHSNAIVRECVLHAETS